MAVTLRNRVRERREAREVSQVDLAKHAQLTRQSISAIEAGRAVPSVEVALRIATALDCQVEELFTPASEQAQVETEQASLRATDRVALAHIDGRWVSLSLAGDGLRLAADGVVVSARSRRVVVERLRSAAEAMQNVILTGCAAGLGLLADRLNSRAGAGRFLWIPTSSAAAIDALARGRAHIAGVHLTDPKTGEVNVSDVRRAGSKEALTLLTLARWEAGLVARPQDADRIRGPADLARRGTRLVVREQGAGAQRLLEQVLRDAGLSVDLARNSRLKAFGHLDVARSVAMNAADVGVATRDAAMAFGLRFIPLAEERYDLVVPRSLLADRRIERLFDVLGSSAVRRELSSLGYDMAHSGERVAEVSAQRTDIRTRHA